MAFRSWLLWGHERADDNLVLITLIFCSVAAGTFFVILNNYRESNDKDCQEYWQESRLISSLQVRL